MHEASIMDSLLALAAEEADRAGLSGRVTRLEVTVGHLSGVNPEALRFAFEMLAPDSRCAGAELIIIEPLATCNCRGCGAKNEVDDPFCCCPDCDSPEVVISGGQELLLSSLEIEDQDKQ